MVREMADGSIDPTYPQTERELYLCAMALAFVRGCPNKRYSHYLEMLRVVTAARLFFYLLPSRLCSEFVEGINRLPATVRDSENEPLDGHLIRDYLIISCAVQLGGPPLEPRLSPGINYDEIRESLPTIPPRIVGITSGLAALAITWRDASAFYLQKGGV